MKSMSIFDKAILIMSTRSGRYDSSLLAKALQSILMSYPIRLIGLKEEHSLGGLFGFRVKVIIASLKDGGSIPFI